MNRFNLGICQMEVGTEKENNLEKARVLVKEAVEKGADMVALPEMWNCPYSNKFFVKFAEEEGGNTYRFMSELSKELGIYLIGGSIPEKVISNGEQKIYNTSYIFDREGKLIGKHRKVHLFDIDIKEKITFKESDTLTAGDSFNSIDTEFGKIGVAICFDIRFPEGFRKMALEGAKLIILPGAFNMNTGPAHWHTTIKIRAVDNQVYFAGVAPARVESKYYVSYAHSCVFNPWGDEEVDLGKNEGVSVCEIDLDYLESIREQLPLLSARMPESY